MKAVAARPVVLPSHTFLFGVGACSGAARGPVRWVREPLDLASLRPGEIVVAEHLPAAWATMLRRAGGVVTARGSALGSSSTILRELRVPSVVGVTKGLEAVADGQPIELDGELGIVRIFPR